MEYIKSIALFLILVSFVENVFDFGHMKKYIKLFCGIILIFILLQPIKELLGGDIDATRLLEINEMKLRMSELQADMEEKNVLFDTVEDTIKEIVWDEGYELTYIMITPDEKNSYDIGGVSISIKEMNNVIQIKNIVLEEKKEYKVSARAVRISEKIADMYGLEQEDVVVNIE